MKEFLTTDGRYNRLRYFGFSVLVSIIGTIISTVLQLAAGNSESFVPFLFLIVLLIVEIYLSVCITVKRFHDLGKPGTHYFLLFIPFYNIYIALVLLFKKGDTGANAYGEDPLA
jgi:uncharacterized membrane protein YhaH (DUF805 family)